MIQKWVGVVSWVRKVPVPLVAAVILGFRAYAGSSTPDPVITLDGDWRIKVVVSSENGREASATVDVPRPEWITVTAERHESLPLFNANAGGWAKGARLRAVVAQECTTPFLVDPASVSVRPSPEPGAAVLEPGRDYGLDPAWATLGRLPGGALGENQPAFIDYRHGRLRLDSIVLTTNGQVELRAGEPKASAPVPPALAKGERRLANVWLPGVIPRLGPQNLFPIREASFPEPGVQPPTPAERMLPKTMAKLQAGKPLRVLAWGDSVTDGGYLPGGKPERWQEQFAARLKGRFPAANIELITEAWGGRNTSSYLGEPPGSEHNYAEKVLNRKPDLIVSEFVNDAGLAAEQVEPHYLRFLKDFQSIGAEWIILTPHYVRPDWMGLNRENDIDEDPRPYVAGLRKFTTAHGVALADASQRYGRLWRQGLPYSTLMLNSINHPNAYGMSLFVDSLMALFPKENREVAAAWEFDRDGDFEGWRPNGDLAELRVQAGVLHARAQGADPILEYQLPLDLAADPWDTIQARLKADRDGEAEFFWSNTNQGRYGGFSQEKSTRFPVRGDHQWRTYIVRPFWHPEGRIRRLRFDLYDAARFEVDWVRVVKASGVPAERQAEFDFKSVLLDWRPEGGMALSVTNGCLLAKLEEADGLALAPPVNFDSNDRSYLCVRLAADRGRYATLHFAVADRPGLQSYSFPIQADGKARTYNLDMLSAPNWNGRIVALAIRPSEQVGSVARVEWLKASAAPQGEAELAIRWFGLEGFPARATKPATLAARIANTGGEPATNISARVQLPKGIRLSPEPKAPGLALGPGEEATLRWSVVANKPGPVEASLLVQAGPDGTSTAATGSTHLDFSSVPRGAKRGYVPAPKPVRGPYEVGVYYFPGWQSASQWQPIRGFPERRPVLGWYREGDPEIADWHIKWAVEHGITFFIYDWYWVRGARQLEHALHDGYFKARYRSLLKFCLLWANHNPPGTSSREDCLAVTRYWVDSYFRRPEHMTVDGKPVVVIFSPDRLAQDLGADQVRPVLDAMRAECSHAGLKGLYFAAVVNSAAEARLASAQGYDAVTGYTWPHLGVPAGEFRAPYAGLLEGYRLQWQHILDTAGIPLLPPVCGGWDSRPWHGENNFVRFDRTPELFRRHLLDARQFLEANSQNPGLRKLLIVEAWNEWGEGAYIEPHTEFGFGYLDAIRDALTPASGPHADLAPVDVGRGPYDVAIPPKTATSWDFNQDAEGWHALMNVELGPLTGGCLTMRTLAADPAIVSSPLEIRSADFTKLLLRIRVAPEQGEPRTDHGQVYWSTDRFAESSATGVGFEVVADGKWHELQIDLASNPRWRGKITRLRLDPCEQPGMRLDIDWMRLKP
jgi:lysophospholipase L1-like esterase